MLNIVGPMSLFSPTTSLSSFPEAESSNMLNQQCWTIRPQPNDPKGNLKFTIYYRRIDSGNLIFVARQSLLSAKSGSQHQWVEIDFITYDIKIWFRTSQWIIVSHINISTDNIVSHRMSCRLYPAKKMPDTASCYWKNCQKSVVEKIVGNKMTSKPACW